MKTCPKSLAIAFTMVSIIISGGSVDLAGAQDLAKENRPFAELTDEERAWIREHPVIRVGVDHYPPFEIVDGKGGYEGLGAEYLRRVGENTGLKFKILTGLTWAQVQEGAKNGTVDLIPVITDTAERRKFLRFTEGYLHEPNVVISRFEHQAVEGLADLKGQTMAVSEGYSEIEDLNKRFPSIRQVVVRDPLEELKLVASGQVDACQGNLAVLIYYIRKYNMANLKVAGPSDITGGGVMGMGSRRDWPILHSILQKGLNAIGEAERIAISRKWTPDLGDAEQKIVELTSAEQAWLAKHKDITIGHIPGWPPYSFLDSSGRPVGISIDFFELVAKKVGLQFKVDLDVWNNIYKRGQDKEIDVVASMAIKPYRKQWFLFPRHYLDLPVYIVTRKDDERIRDREDLKGKIISQDADSWYVQEIHEKFPTATLKLVDRPENTLLDVSTGKADATLAVSGIALHTIAEKGLYNLHLAGVYAEKDVDRITFGVRSDYPELASIIDKGLAAITEGERLDILHRWIQPAEPSEKVKLSEVEKAWLRQHPVMRVGVDANWPPVEFFDAEGKLAGITADHIRILTEKMGTRFETAGELSWSEVLQKARQREIDIIPAIVKSEKRGGYLLFTEPYLKLPMVVVTRDDAPVIEGIQDLKDRTIAVIEGVIIHDYLKRDYPDQELLLFKTLDEALQAVDDGEADALIENAAAVNLASNRLGLSRLTVAAPTPYAYELSIGVRKDWPELVPILDKILASITPREKEIIKEKWGDIRFQKQTDWRMVVWIVSAILLLTGGIVGIFYFSNRSLAREVVMRKQAREEAEMAIAGAQAGTMFLDIPRGHLTWDQRSLDIFGVDAKTFGHRFESWENLVHPDDLVGIQEMIEKQLKSGKRIDIRYRIIRPDGEIRHIWANANIIRNSQGEPEALAGLHFDETDRVTSNLNLQKAKDETEAVNRELAESRAMLQLVMDSVPALISYIDKGLRYRLANAFYENLLGFKPEDMIGRHIREIIGEEGYAVEKPKFEEALTGKVVVREDAFTREDGRHFWYIVNLIPHFDDGEVKGVFALVTEITERKELENRLREAKETAEAANRAKSIFLANMSHELRTPLNAILGFSSILGHDTGATPTQKEKLAVINQSGERLLAMINDILDISKIEAGKIELEESPIDLVALLREISTMIQSRAWEKGLDFVLATEAVTLTNIKTDEGKLRQILFNLLGNAVKFTREGRVTLRAATEPLADSPRRCRIVLEVEDTGPGIDAARQAEIFKPFVQAHGVSAQAGTGLGLSICKNFAEIMGGTIEVESAAEKGALFRLRLPVDVADAADVTISDTKPRVIGLAPGQKNRRILIADDHPDNRFVLKSLLEVVGFTVVEATNGQEALETYQKEAPDFIWMDMRMPVMDGYEAVRQIRQHPGGADVPIAAITASVFLRQRQGILAAGCDEIVFKPFREHEIFEVMARFLGLEYIYAESEDVRRLPKQTDLTAAMLNELPADLRHALDETTLVANREAIFKVIDNIQDQTPETAAPLRVLVQNFEIERIRELLDEVP